MYAWRLHMLSICSRADQDHDSITEADDSDIDELDQLFDEDELLDYTQIPGTKRPDEQLPPIRPIIEYEQPVDEPGNACMMQMGLTRVNMYQAYAEAMLTIDSQCSRNTAWLFLVTVIAESELTQYTMFYMWSLPIQKPHQEEWRTLSDC